MGKIAELTPPNGWRAGLVCRVLSAEPVLRRPICQTLFKRGVGAALVAAQRRSLQTPRRILSLRGTRTQYSKDNENEFHGDPIIPRTPRHARPPVPAALVCRGIQRRLLCRAQPRRAAQMLRSFGERGFVCVSYFLLGTRWYGE